MKPRYILPLAKYYFFSGSPSANQREAVNHAVKWLCAAQDAVDGGGISRAYSLQEGWELPYPETTGYIIPTFLEMARQFPELNLCERAWRAGRWLAEVQFESGAICSKQLRPGNTKPSVFNTGQVLHGWISLLEVRDDEQILTAARRAIDWLIREQETDGAWVTNAFLGRAHTYYTMVDWALVRYARLTGDDRARISAVMHLDWTLRNQRENGWYDLCDFSAGEAVLTHTISYTTQGLVESGRILGEERYIQSAVRGTEKLRKCFDATGKLSGTFDNQWQPTAEWECCTGSAQTSLVWQALAEAAGNSIWNESARKLNSHMLGYQKIHCRTTRIDGAIPGSWPLTGNYDPLNFPNHAAKFYVDALSGLAGS